MAHMGHMGPLARFAGIRPICPIGPIFLLLLAAAGIARGQATIIDQLFLRHVRVKATVGGGVLHLLYERKADPQAAPTSCYKRLVPGQGWLGEEYLHGGHSCVAFFDNALYVFRRTNYSVYRAGDWTASTVFGPADSLEGGGGGEWHTNAWPFEWPPQAACTVGDELWAFGVEAAEGTRRIRAATIGPAAKPTASPGPKLIGEPLATKEPPSDLSAIADGSAALVFWHQDAAGREGNELWHASFDGSGWTPPQAVPAPYPACDYAAARHQNTLWLVFRARGERIKGSRPLVAASLADGHWRPPAEVPGARDPQLDWTLDIDAVSFDGALLVFRACMDRVVSHRFAEGAWGAPEVLIELSPWPTYVFWWLMGNVVLCLILLPVVGWAALRARAKPRVALRAFGTEVPMASWARRVAAQLVDILVGLLLASGALRWLEAPEAATGADGVLGTLGLCASLFFSYYVLSEGLTGQSFGKLLLRIAVVGRDGRRPAVGSTIIRNLLRPWPFLCPTAYLAGSLILLLTPANQRLGDLLADTFVVELPPPPAPEQQTTD